MVKAYIFIAIEKAFGAIDCGITRKYNQYRHNAK
jgi:hypothetical protein